MRGTVKAGVTACLALALVGFALAQRPGGGRNLGPGALLQDPAVQKELKLTEDQGTKLKDALAKVRDNNKDDFAKFKDASDEEKQQMMRKFGAANDKAIAGVLDEKQMKRFKQLRLQRQGAFAFANPDVQGKLKLSDDQKGKIREIGSDSFKKGREIFQGGNNEETQKKLAELNKETMDKIAGVLNDDQKKTWKEMTGEPFKFEARPRRNKEK